MIYHYCDRITLAEIRSSGVIRAQAMDLYRDALRQGERRTTPPIVWLTINPILEMTVVTKLLIAGWPQGLVGDLGRIVLPDGYASDLGLAEYAECIGIAPDWWEWVVRTGAIVGSHYTTWRIVDRDIPQADWLGCEILAGFADDKTVWSPAT